MNPNDNQPISLGAVAFEVNQRIKPRPIPPNPPSIIHSNDSPRTTHSAPLVNFTERDQDFIITNPDDVDELRLVTRSQLKVFILYSYALCNKAPSARPACPLGYEYFARAYNHEGLTTTASVIDNQGFVKCEGASIEMGNLLDDEDEDITLSATRMDQVDRMVWHTALSAAHQRDKMEECRLMNKKSKNFFKKQQVKMFRKGFGNPKGNTLSTGAPRGTKALGSAQPPVEDEMNTVE
ncbi:uncharacterized protein EDB91DRAFT_447198 [Suillus paluster]|uniref:uncharacterized protein n=1 Tax=Suillus paluster TaxID=48578 RepID=UPI001B85F749|nr:uncharacterized protein EDB91DRAFT_447198 [Suillus paluster]KAG1738624.1 hypothetical protein EDB91DRAFT_447198 [Suillus paluster]